MDYVVGLDSRNLLGAYKAGARFVIRQRMALNQINVFPVPDGDTGNNLASLMQFIVREAKEGSTPKATMDGIAEAALLGARGNSGIIFAQYFYGLSNELSEDLCEVTLDDFANIHEKAVAYAYEAIEVPEEGTMLTAMKHFGQALSKYRKTDFQIAVDKAVIELDEVVKNTQTQLKCLKQAKVVDAGAKGFFHFIEGLRAYFRGEIDDGDPSDFVVEEFLNHHVASEITYRYCTEGLIEDSSASPERIKGLLKELGDAIIVAGSLRKMRVHIHTNEPEKVIDILSGFGNVVFHKAEDMVRQNSLFDGPKYPIALVTDSVADLPSRFIEEHQIQVLHLKLLYKDSYFIDRLTVTNEKLLEYSKNSERITSSQPEYLEVVNMLNVLKTQYKQILILPVAKVLSGTYNVFAKAIQEISEPGFDIRIVDSRENSVAQGMLVKYAADRIASGDDLDTLELKIKQQVANSRIYVAVATLDAMVRSGRLSSRGALIANKLRMKPIVTLKESGEGGLAGMAIGQQGSLKKIKQKLLQLKKNSTKLKYSVIHVENSDGAMKYADELTQVLGQPPEYIETTSGVIALGAGAGAIAVGVLWEV